MTDVDPGTHFGFGMSSSPPPAPDAELMAAVQDALAEPPMPESTMPRASEARRDLINLTPRLLSQMDAAVKDDTDPRIRFLVDFAMENGMTDPSRFSEWVHRVSLSARNAGFGPGINGINLLIKDMQGFKDARSKQSIAGSLF